MPRAGDELVDPVTGLQTIFCTTARETDGELLQMDWIGGAGWVAGPDHVHPIQEERLQVVSGRLGARVAGVERTHGAGEVVTVPAGTSHTLWNAGDGEVYVLVEFSPALRSERMLETLAALARDGRTNGAGLPRNPLQLALLMRDYRDEIHFARPSLPLQRVVFGALAWIGGLLGYRAEHSYPYARRRQAYPVT